MNIKELLLSVLEDCDERVTIGEDLVVFFSYLRLAESLYVTDGFWPYHYRINSASMIQSFSSIKYEKIDILRQTLLFNHRISLLGNTVLLLLTHRVNLT